MKSAESSVNVSREVESNDDELEEGELGTMEIENMIIAPDYGYSRTGKYESSVHDHESTLRNSSRTVEEEGSFRNTFSNGKNYHRKEYSLGDRKFRGNNYNYTSSKSQKLTDDSYLERPYRNASSSDKYSSRHYESPVSSKYVYNKSRHSAWSPRKHSTSPRHSEWSPRKHSTSPRHSELSPRDREQDRSPAHPDRSPYDQRNDYDHSKSPYSNSDQRDSERAHYRSPARHDRSNHNNQSRSSYSQTQEANRYNRSKSPYEQSRQYGNRNRSPDYSKWTPQARTPTVSKRSVEPKKSGAATKLLSCSKVQKKKPFKKVLKSLPKVSIDKSNKSINHESKKDDHNANIHTEDLASMEEDMDICETPPRVTDPTEGKWVYLDEDGVEHGPSRLCDLQKLVQGGVLVPDHFIKHIDHNRWVTVENATSPLVTANFTSIVSDNVTEMVISPEAPGNLLSDNNGSSLEPIISSIESDNASKDLYIDERVEALLMDVTVIPGMELETIGEVLQMTFEHEDLKQWGIVEDLQGKEGDSSVISREVDEMDENTLGYENVDEMFSGLWSCKGGDWRRTDEAIQVKSIKRKHVVNDGYPLCEMFNSRYKEDPRWQRKDELYRPSQITKLGLYPWAFTFTSPDESTQSNPIGKGTSLPVIRINACVVKDRGSFVSVKEKHNSKVLINKKRLLEEGEYQPIDINEPDSKSPNLKIIPKDHIFTAEELQLNIGNWCYLDGSGHEHGPYTYPELQKLSDQGVIHKNSSVFRKVDGVWVPVSLLTESKPTLQIQNSVFHDMHPQFIGYTRGKLHELVMKSYKSREFAADINEYLYPWMNARQPKKDKEKRIFHNSGIDRSRKDNKTDQTEDDYYLMENSSANVKEDSSFDDLNGDITSSNSKTYDGLRRQIDDSKGLQSYLENSGKRESANQLFHRSLYKRSKLYDARKSSNLLSRDSSIRRLAMRKYESGYKRIADSLTSRVKDIMKQNNFYFFVPKVARIQKRIKNGYYAGRGLSSMKEDLSRMCRDGIKLKNRGNAGDMNHIITLFIQLATSLDCVSKLSNENNSKSDSPPGFSYSNSSKYKKSFNKVNEKKYISRNNESVSEYGEYASDREIRRRLSKLNKKNDFDRSSEESSTDSESTDSETETELNMQTESGILDYFTPDDGLDSLTDDHGWGARMTKESLVPPVTRKYEVINNNVIVADEELVKRKLQVSLPDDYNIQRNGIDESEMEIPEVKDYKPRKELGYEVIEQEVYGIDPYTHNLVIDSMPDDSDWSLLDKHEFIDEVLLITLNKVVRHFTGTGNVPMTYSLKPVFEVILDTAFEENDKKIIKLCQHVLKAIYNRPEENYIAYRKGLGVVCGRKSGFSKDDFIVQFLGEIYPAWRWFEKQDGIHSVQNNTDPVTEFYNIYLERPKGDADGYDLVVIDAMHKSNYASRICHSCRPNCEAKVTAVNGEYQIGIHTVRPIRYGEEITYDYNSVTESKEEYEASVCLCGNHVCRGSYLDLTGEGSFQKVLKENHGILDRVHLMIEACELNSVSEEDYIELSKAGLGSCLLGGLPDWLIAYTARLVRFINFERTKLPDEILKHSVEEKKKYFTDIDLESEKCEAEVQAEGVYNQRLQNLAVTLDKVRYVMRCVYGDPKKSPPPLERLSPREMISYIWKGEGSVVEELINNITPHIDDVMLNNLKANIHAHDPFILEDDDDHRIHLELSKSLKWLRDEIRNLACTYKCRHDAAADLIHLYAHTNSFFRIREYESVTSPAVYISPLDLSPKYAHKVGPNGLEYSKTYAENYCLGQLIYWYSQNSANPDICLNKASRGCLSLPQIESFYSKLLHKPLPQKVYGPKTLKLLLSRIEKQPERAWPKDRIWSFESCLKIIGSPMLDSVVKKSGVDKEMVYWLKHRPPIFQAMGDT